MSAVVAVAVAVAVFDDGEDLDVVDDLDGHVDVVGDDDSHSTHHKFDLRTSTADRPVVAVDVVGRNSRVRPAVTTSKDCCTGDADDRTERTKPPKKNTLKPRPKSTRQHQRKKQMWTRWWSWRHHRRRCCCFHCYGVKKKKPVCNFDRSVVTKMRDVAWMVESSVTRDHGVRLFPYMSWNLRASGAWIDRVVAAVVIPIPALPMNNSGCC